MNKIRWRVQPAPTGTYRSFHRRGWPTGECGDFFFMIGCEDDYVPARVRSGDHSELSLSVGLGSKTFRYSRRFKTLEELKQFAAERDLDVLRKS